MCTNETFKGAFSGVGGGLLVCFGDGEDASPWEGEGSGGVSTLGV